MTPRRKRILALDMGERRIGVAVSDPTGTVARPVGVVESRSQQEDLRAIRDLVAEHNAKMVVVGRPLTLRGEIGPQAEWVEEIVQSLTEALSVPVRMWDERYTTSIAEDILRQTRRKGRRREKSEVDAVAAAVILQSFLDSQTMEL